MVNFTNKRTGRRQVCRLDRLDEWAAMKTVTLHFPDSPVLELSNTLPSAVSVPAGTVAVVVDDDSTTTYQRLAGWTSWEQVSRRVIGNG